MKKITLENYKKEKYYPKIVNAIETNIDSSNFVSPISVFEAIGLLKKKDIENWRKGQVPYLEKVIQCNLSKASRILRILSFVAHDYNLKRSVTVYKRQGKGRKELLQFSKTGDRNLEKAYSTHFINLSKKQGGKNSL